MKQWRDGPEDFGAMYLAVGRPYLAMALTSALSLRLTNPDVKLAFVTDAPTGLPPLPWLRDSDRSFPVSAITESEDPVRKRLPNSLKPRLYALPAFASTLLLDADTIVTGDLSVIRISLTSLDLVAKPSPPPNPSLQTSRFRMSNGLLVGQTCSCNTGVVGFRRNAPTEHFFLTWKRLQAEMNVDFDQPSFMPAIHEAPDVRFGPIPQRFNAGTRDAVRTPDVAIIHYKRRADRTTRRLVHRVGSAAFGPSPALAKEISAALRPRGKKAYNLSHIYPRNRDLLLASPVEGIVDRAVSAGWLGKS